MTKEDKQLLLQDLCARLPYGVKVKYRDIIGKIQYIESEFNELCLEYPNNDYTVSIEDVKPYLRSIEDITEEEFKKSPLYGNANCSYRYYRDAEGFHFLYLETFDIETLDWLNANHFNYRLPDHLYIRVTKENNPYET